MQAWCANILGLAAALAALALGLWAGAPEASAAGPSRRATVTAPAGSEAQDEEVAIGDSMQLWGQPTRLSMFHTDDSTDEVLQTYIDAWKSAESEPIVKHMGRLASVSVVDPESGLMRSAMVQDLGDVRLVIPSLTDVRAFPDLSERSAPVPVPENALHYTGQVADDATSLSYHGSFTTTMSSATAIEFYRRELVAAGYAERRSDFKSSKADAAEFVRGPETVQVLATTLEEASKRATFVVVQHTRELQQGEQP
jgi:hypothetical protein